MLKSKLIKSFIISGALFVLSSNTVQAATYTVSKGDTLYSIGKLFNTSYTTIMKDNSLANSQIYIGQALNINCDIYTVKAGDSLYLIAKKYGISVDALRKANNKWDNNLAIGQKLLIPGVTSGTNSNVSSSPSVIPYTASDLDLLARLINAEAGNQSYNAKIAVGAAVINRVQSTLFPNTLSGVIYQISNGYYQYTPVQNGYINNPATSDSISAAYEALHGGDPTNGAIYYYDTSSTSAWLRSRPVSIQIGSLIFAY